MKAYVIVFCGYERIDAILGVEQDAETAAQEVRVWREKAARVAALGEAKYDLPYQQMHADDPKRICVMTQKGEDDFQCCCQALGVGTGEEAWLY